MKLPSATPPDPRIDVYELIGNGPGYKFYAICFPQGGRNITTFGASEKEVISYIRSML